MKNHFCVNCGKTVKRYNVKLCRSCAAIERWKNIKKSDKFCVDCGKQISRKDAIRCKKCYNIHRQKIDNFCIDCGKKITSSFGTTIFKRCHKCASTRDLNGGYKDGRTTIKHCCIDCGIEIKNYQALRCITCSKQGKNSPNWIDGRSYEKYPKYFTGQLKEQIRKRDNYTCKNCNITEEEHLIVYGRALHVHHIDYNRKNCIDENLITLCQGCNLRANKNRDYWKEFYTEKIGEKSDSSINA